MSLHESSLEQLQAFPLALDLRLELLALLMHCIVLNKPLAQPVIVAFHGLQACHQYIMAPPQEVAKEYLIDSSGQHVTKPLEGNLVIRMSRCHAPDCVVTRIRRVAIFHPQTTSFAKQLRQLALLLCRQLGHLHGAANG